MKLQPHLLNSELLSFPKEATFTMGEHLPASSKWAWLIKTGVIKTYTWNQEGNAIILGYWGRGELIGPPLSVVSPYLMQCRTAVEVQRVVSEEWSHWGQCLCHHCQESEKLLYINRMEPLQERLRLFLLWLASKFGRPVEAGWHIDFKLTHQELAEAVGGSRVSITRLISELEREGEIERWPPRSIVVKGKSIL